MKPTSSERDEESLPLSLRVVRGVHAGAQRGCACADMVVVGSADDCDLILADSGVAAHHCVLKIDGAHWTIRALDGDISVDTRRIAAGDSVTLALFDVIGVGSAALALGEPNDERWQHLIEPIEQASSSDFIGRRSSRGLIAGIGVGVCLVTAIAAASLSSTQPTHLPSPRAILESSVRDVELEKAEIRQDHSGKLSVSGLADDPSRIERLRGELAARGVVAEVDVRSGKDIARDVGEVLRLSDLPAEAEYRGDGEVGIRGHFGDGKKLDAVLASRSIRDVKGLTKVAVVNLDSGKRNEPEPTTENESKHIVVAVGGTDPYVVMADGSRYFAGAQLPCGGRLHAVEGQEIYVDTGVEVRALECTGSIVQTAIRSPELFDHGVRPLVLPDAQRVEKAQASSRPKG